MKKDKLVAVASTIVLVSTLSTAYAADEIKTFATVDAAVNSLKVAHDVRE